MNKFKKYLPAAASIFLLIFINAAKTTEESLPTAPVSGATQGFADMNGGVTGGLKGETVTVSDQFSLKQALNDNAPRTIYISGKIDLEQSRWTNVGSNKTIVGINNASLRFGGFLLKSSSNVIIKNIEFHDAVTLGTETEFDCISIIDGSTNIWIDHCTFSDDPESDLMPSKHHDGLIDIKRGSNFITISYCEFHNHDKTCLLGHDDKNVAQDTGKIKVTLHHNYFNKTVQRHPRVRFGRVHAYNNYYDTNSNYSIGAGFNANIYSEKNFFENIIIPFQFFGESGAIKDTESFFLNSGYPTTNPNFSWTPNKYYEYKTDNAKDVKDICLKYSGAGKPEKQ